MAGDYPDGVWRYDTSTGWSHISNEQPAGPMALDGNGDVYGTFSDGLWRWDAGTSGWQKLSGLKPLEINVTAGGVLYGVFANDGLWRWSFAGWQQLSAQTPDLMAVSDSDAFFGRFDTGTAGTWRWTPTQGWSLLSASRPDGKISADAAGDLVAGYSLFIPAGQQGTWRWSPTTGWARLSTATDAFSLSDNGVIYQNQGAGGIWRWAPGQVAFTQISTANSTASFFIALPDGGLFEDFAIPKTAHNSGWYYSAAGNWAQVIPDLDSATFVVGGKDDAIFIANDNMGTWLWSPTLGYQQLGSQQPSWIKSQIPNVDG
jgi:hypothetical protein